MKYFAMVISVLFILRGLAAVLWPNWHLRQQEDEPADPTSPPPLWKAWLTGAVCIGLGLAGLWALLIDGAQPGDAAAP